MALCACGLLALAGCGGGRTAAGTATDPANPAGQAAPPSAVVVPPLPGADAPASPVHRTSATDLTVSGDGFTAAAGGNNAPGAGGTYAIIPGGQDELGFAEYTLPNVTSSKPVTLQVNVTAAPAPGGGGELALSYWVGIADYTDYRWEWHGPLAASASFELNGGDERDRYVSASGAVSYVVLTVADAPPTPSNPQGLTGVSVQSSVTTTATTYLANLPHYPLIDNLGPGNGKAGSAARHSSASVQLDPDLQYVTVKWEHVAAFNPDDEQNAAFQYEVFRQGPLDQYPVNIGSELAPEEVYVDPLDNASVSPDPIPGLKYQYFVRAINPAGYTPLSPAGSLRIPLLPPANLAASDGVFDDKIRLVWSKAAGATSYEIYRDAVADPVATVGDVNTWADLDVPDTAVHIYAVKSRNPFARSGFSKLEPGSKRQAVQSYDLLDGDQTDGPFVLMVNAAFNPTTDQPVASYTTDIAANHDDATHLFQFDPGNGWQESTPVHHGGFSGGAPCALAFRPNGDLAFCFGNIAWMAGNYETDFLLQPAGQGPGSPELVGDGGAGGPVRLAWGGSAYGLIYEGYSSQPYLAFSTGLPGSFQEQPNMPLLNDSNNDWNYDLAFDSAGDPYIAYVDGYGQPLNLWWSTGGSSNITTLDSGACFGVNLAAGQDGKMFIFYQHLGELWLSEGAIDKLTFDSSFVNSQVTGNNSVDYLDDYSTGLAVDSQNQPHIIYPTDTLTEGDEKVWYNYRDAQGWETPYELDFNGQTYIGARKCAIALDSADHPLCVFTHDPVTVKAVWFK
jgi:hypothetical protein